MHKTITQVSGFINTVQVDPVKDGLLRNISFAAKDVINIKGQKTGCGNPSWEKKQQACGKHALCIEQLLSSGASLVGKTITGEFCSGSTGVNHFYGLPKNIKYPKRVPGGSSSGSASVVAENLVDFSLGTDSAGSVRIPASFCGLYGMRPSHGLISLDGVKTFVPSFDTVGFIAKKIDIIDLVFKALFSVPENSLNKIKFLYIIDDFMHLLSPDYKKNFTVFVSKISELLRIKPYFIKLESIHADINDNSFGMSAVFKKIFCAEAWENMSDIVKMYNLEFQKNTFVDFSPLSKTDRSNMPEVYMKKEIYSLAINNLLSSSGLLCVPTTPDIAPLIQKTYSKVNQFNYNRLRPFIALSGVAKLPQITIPVESLQNRSAGFGVSILSRQNQDFLLLAVVKKINDALGLMV